MGRINKKEQFLDAAMEVVSEVGLTDFSMRQVTQKLGVSEALLYRYYDSKENLLASAFLQCNQRIAQAFETLVLLPVKTRDDAVALLQQLWVCYFNALVEGGFRTVFYFEYRDYYRMRLNNTETFQDSLHCFHYPYDLISQINHRYHLLDSVPPNYLWTYLLDTSGMFARLVIKKYLPDTPETRSVVWELLSSGIQGFFPPA